MLSMAKSVHTGRLTRLGERLRSLREAFSERSGKKFTQRDAAKIAGINEATYRSYEYGRAQVPEDVARKLASEWGIDWRQFFNIGSQAATPATPFSDVTGPIIPIPSLVIPVPYVGNVGANSKADWLNPVDTGESIDVPNEMATPVGPESMRFACTVVGDSCYDLLWPGDIAVFHKCDVPKLGQVMLFRSFDDHVTIKQIKHNGREFFLHPLNPAYEDCPAHGVVVGYLVGIVRTIGSRKMTIYDRHGITP